MAPKMRLKEIEETRLVHNELAPSQIDFLIARVKKLESALQRIKDVGSALREIPGRPTSFADWELRMIARKALGGWE